MRNYSSRKKENSFQTSNYKRIATALTAVFLALFTLYFFTTHIEAVARFVNSPFLSLGRFIETSEGAFPAYLRGIHSLREENERLNDVIAEYSQARTELALSQYNTEELTSLLENVHDDDRGIVAGVLSAPPFSPYDVLVIDKGENSGVLKGSVVYHHGNRAIGIVQKVFADTSLVTLFTSSGSQVSAYLANAKIFVHAYGMGGDVLRLSVPPDVSVNIGELVLLSGVRGGYLGRVEVIDANPARAEKSAYIAPASSRTYRLVRVARTAIPDSSREEIRTQIEAETAFLLSTSTPNQEIISN